MDKAVQMNQHEKLAAELGLDVEVAKSMTVRDMRKMLRQNKRGNCQDSAQGGSQESRDLFSFNIDCKPKTTTQAKYLDSIKNNTLSIGIGSAGTGKTHIPTAYALECLRKRQVDRIICTRPNVQAGEDFGFLPGTLEEKYFPYMKPIIEIMSGFLPEKVIMTLIKEGRLVGMPVNFLRGNNFHNSFVLLDEGQNLTPKQAELILSRVGENSKVVINGDYYQCDIEADLVRDKQKPGLIDVLTMTSGMSSIGVTVFDEKDIVRSDFSKEIIMRYNDRARHTNSFVRMYDAVLKTYK